MDYIRVGVVVCIGAVPAPPVRHDCVVAHTGVPLLNQVAMTVVEEVASVSCCIMVSSEVVAKLVSHGVASDTRLLSPAYGHAIHRLVLKRLAAALLFLAHKSTSPNKKSYCWNLGSCLSNFIKAPEPGIKYQ